MRYPEALLLPVLMFADYYLTLLGAIKYEKHYSRHFEFQHYELNPVWQKDVAAKRRFNPRHAALTVLGSAGLIWIVELTYVPDDFASFVLGLALVGFGMLLGKHIFSLLAFWHVARRPAQISGKVTMSHQYSLSMSLYQAVGFLIPIAMIAVFSKSFFAVGGLVAVVCSTVIHLVWIIKARKQAPGGNMERPSEDHQDIKAAEPLRYARVYSDSYGETHFADEEVRFELADYAPPAPPISVSGQYGTEGMTFISSPAGWVGDFHPAPRRQFVLVLSGELEVEVSDGELRRLGPGSFCLVEDTEGKGHISRVTSSERCFALAVPLTERQG